MPAGKLRLQRDFARLAHLETLLDFSEALKSYRDGLAIRERLETAQYCGAFSPRAARLAEDENIEPAKLARRGVDVVEIETQLAERAAAHGA